MKGLSDCLGKQFYRLEYLIKLISPETFWAVFPEILGIDAQINLLMELVSLEVFSNEEIIRIVEKDYRYYFKELCGYDLKMNNIEDLDRMNKSIVIHVSNGRSVRGAR